ncbi:MAG: hypothetical protein H6623_06350 [Bdellovibrionaceae bacterium]|nr:hypothetical protein [Pseudobdellovibrionaceae bacterium]
MLKIVVFFSFFLYLAMGLAESSPAPFYVNPYYPEFSSNDENLSRALMDQNLENEVRQYMDRRERVQQLWTEYMPANHPQLLPSNSFIFKRMMDRGSRRAFKSSWIKNSFLGKTAESVKHNLQTEMNYVDSGETHHRFDFKIAAFQGVAFIQYEGSTKAQLRYSFTNGGALAMIFQHDLSQFSSIGIESTLAGKNPSQSVNLNIVW